MIARLLRGASQIQIIENVGGYTNSTAPNFIGSVSSTYLDSPATTSSTTYKIQFASGANNIGVFISATSGGTNALSTITLLEIAA
jgi:hypothetical protein